MQAGQAGSGLRREFGSDRRDLAAAYSVLAVWAAITALRSWGNWGEDLSALYFAARFASDGAWGLAYAGPEHVIGYGMTPEWEAAAAALGHAEDDLNRYLYPPLWAALFAPLAAAVSPAAFCNGAAVVLSVGFASAAAAAVRMAAAGGVPALRAALLAVAVMQLAFPFEFARWLQQPQIIVVALILWSAERALAGREGAAGLLLALAASIKIVPALLALAFLACGMRHAVLSGAAWGAAFLALSIALAGVPAHVAFLAALAEVKEIVHLSVANPSLASLLTLAREAALGTDLSAFGASAAVAPAPGLKAAVAVVALAGVGATMLAIRHTPVAARLLLGMVMLYLVATFTTGFAWLHYLMLPCLVLVWLPTLWPLGRCVGIAAALLAPVSTPFIVGAIVPDTQSVAVTALSGAVIVAFWAVFACAARSAARRAGATGPAPAPQPA